MGNCCGAESDEPSTFTNGHGSGNNTKAFQGQGNRLGTAEEYAGRAPQELTMSRQREEELSQPIHDPNLTDAMREKQRADRLAAVEARMKAQAPKKKPTTSSSSSAPLRGPNSEPLMRWSAG